MRITITSNIEDVRKRNLDRWQRVEQNVIATTATVVNEIAAEIQQKGPKGVAGTYQNPVKKILPGYQGTIVTGIVGIKAPHAEPTDLGFVSHGFPAKNLIPWVNKVLGISNAVEAKKVAFAVMLKLKERGYKGHKIFRDLTHKYSKIFLDRIFFTVRFTK